jgi:Ca2+-binding EF-hand superfamily protein
VSVAELVQRLSATGERMPRREVEEALAAVGVRDTEGTIDLQTFIRLMQ